MKRPGKRKLHPSISGLQTLFDKEARVFSETSKCGGRLVLLWMIETRSRTLSFDRRSVTFNRTKSQPRDLLSIARFNSARSLRLNASSSQARMAQSCLGSNGRFWATRRPLFQGRSFDWTAGSRILDMSFPPSFQPLHRHNIGR